jgi:prepilin-type N-terminal cleavage/methylation domain-containing protein
MKKNKGFTLIELLVVIVIIGFLSSVVLVSVQMARMKAYYAREKLEANQMIKALELYSTDHNDKYPCDVGRALPPGLEKYISTNPNWPGAPWPGSVYDWDYWSNNDATCSGPLVDTTHGPGPVYQLSVRFCDATGLVCNFPNDRWADGIRNFKNSSIYWCISGPCRAHGSEPYDYPGCCFGGNCPSDQPTCGF